MMDLTTRVEPRTLRRTSPGAAAVLVPVLVSLVLTAWRYDAKPLWRDEVYTLITAGRGFADMLELLAVRDAGLVGYYTLMNQWLAVTDATWWLRLPTALATPVVVGLCAVLGRRAGGSRTALVAGLLAALAPSVVRHAQEARPYALVLAAVLLIALLLLRIADDPRRSELAALAGVSAVAVALHPLVAVPAVAGLYAAAWLVPGRAERQDVVAAGVPAAVVGLVLVAVGFQQAEASPPAPAEAWEYLTFWKIVAYSPVVGVVALVLAVVGALHLWRGARRREALLLGAWALAPVAAVTVLGLMGSYFNARYATASVPAACVLAAVGLTSLGARAVARTTAPLRWAPWALAVAVLAVVAVQAPPAVALRAAPYYFDDAPGAAQELARGARRGDAVVWAGPVARPLVAPHLLPGLRGWRLDDALLVAPAQQTDTRGGQEVPARQRRDVLAPYQRVWLVGTRATATGDLLREGWNAQAAMAGRAMASRQDHGWVRVELWVVPGAPPPTTP